MPIAWFPRKEKTMQIATILLLTTVVAMFIAFGAALAWAEYQTRGMSHRLRAVSDGQANVVKMTAHQSVRNSAVFAGGKNTANEVTNWRPPGADQASARLG
jgi:hypothetical protein